MLYAWLILAVLLFPPLQRRLCALSGAEDRGEGLLRWMLWTLFAVTGGALALWRGGHGGLLAGALRWAAWGLLIAGTLELLAGFIVRLVLGGPGQRVPLLAKLHRYIVDNPDNLYFSRYEPHPFLQYTGRRDRVEGSASNYHYGFRNITLADVPKPDGVIRVACIGGSATEEGYPERLQEYLNREGPPLRFQVLNFGVTWWSSVHCLVNYVLNVIDFRPDYVIFHENCNDHHYRGFPGFRGDAAHAYRVFSVPPSPGEALFRASVLARILRIALAWAIPSVFRVTPAMADIGLRPGKTYDYQPGELRVFGRNVRTLCTLAAAEGSRVCLATVPLSYTRTFGEEHARVYRPHTEALNQALRDAAREHGALLVDLDAAMTGREEYFRDPVHMTEDGEAQKVKAIGEGLLRDAHSAAPRRPA